MQYYLFAFCSWLQLLVLQVKFCIVLCIGRWGANVYVVIRFWQPLSMFWNHLIWKRSGLSRTKCTADVKVPALRSVKSIGRFHWRRTSYALFCEWKPISDFHHDVKEILFTEDVVCLLFFSCFMGLLGSWFGPSLVLISPSTATIRSQCGEVWILIPGALNHFDRISVPSLGAEFEDRNFKVDAW